MGDVFTIRPTIKGLLLAKKKKKSDDRRHLVEDVCNRFFSKVDN